MNTTSIASNTQITMHSNDCIIDTRKVVIAALKFFVIHRDPYILLDYDKTKKDNKFNSLYRHHLAVCF